MSKRSLAAAAVAAVLVLAGCSSEEPGTATNVTTSTSTSVDESTSEETTSEETTSEETTSEEDPTETDEPTGEPIDLDSDSVTFFTSMCTGMYGMVEGMTSAMGIAFDTTSQMAASDKQAALVGAYRTMGQTLVDGAAELSTLPPPGIENGEQAAALFVGALTALGGVFLDATDKLEAASVTDEASLSAALEDMQADIETATEEMGTAFSELETLFGPDLEASVGQIPACAELGIGSGAGE